MTSLSAGMESATGCAGSATARYRPRDERTQSSGIPEPTVPATSV